MNWPMIRSLVAKDLTLFFRNRFFAFVSILGIVAWVGIYLAMPRSIDETLEVALYAPDLPLLLERQLQIEGLRIDSTESEQALREDVAAGVHQVGVVLPAGLLEQLRSGQPAQVTVYLAADLPEEYEGLYTILLEELAFLISGEPLNLEVSEEILGPDMAGMQVPLRDRMRPLFAVFILLVETMGLASLISAELEAGTLRAILITPLRLEGLFLAKAITGIGLAFVQATLFMLLVGGLVHGPALILAALLLGSLLVTGLSFLLASAAKDLLSVMAWSIPALVVLIVPSFGVLLPGALSGWVRIIPSHYLVDTVHQVASLGAGWGEVWVNLLLLLAFGSLFSGLGIVALRRKLR